MAIGYYRLTLYHFGGQFWMTKITSPRHLRQLRISFFPSQSRLLLLKTNMLAHEHSFGGFIWHAYRSQAFTHRHLRNLLRGARHK